MVDTEKLENLIQSSGYKKSFIAQKLGISSVSLWKKANNMTKFTGVEINELCKLLDVTSIKQQREIFFTEEYTE